MEMKDLNGGNINKNQQWSNEMFDKIIRWIYKLPSKEEILLIQTKTESLLIEHYGEEFYKKMKNDCIIKKQLPKDFFLCSVLFDNKKNSINIKKDIN